MFILYFLLGLVFVEFSRPEHEAHLVSVEGLLPDDYLFDRIQGNEKFLLNDPNYRSSPEGRKKRSLQDKEPFAEAQLQESWHLFHPDNIEIHRSSLNITGLQQVFSTSTYSSLEVVTKLSRGKYIGKTNDGQAVWIGPTSIERVTAKNDWTISTTGCDCPQSDSKDCACCEVGACPCSSRNEGVCVPCNKTTSCADQGLPNIDAGVAFPYPYSSFDEFRLNEDVVILAQKGVLHFYSYQNRQRLLVIDGEKQFYLDGEIASIDYVELFTYELGVVRSRRLVLVFFESGERILCFEILEQGSSTPNLRKRLLDGPQNGHDFKVINSVSNKLFVGSIFEDKLRIQEMKVNKTGYLKLINLQTLELKNLGYWTSFKSGEEDFLVMKSHKFLQIFNWNQGKYSLFQDIKLDKEESSVNAIAFPHCGQKSALVLSTQTRLDFYVQASFGNRFEKVWSKSFEAERRTTSDISKFTVDSSVYLIIPMKSDLVFYKVESTLISNAPKDRANIDQKILKKIKRLQKEYEWQESVLTEIIRQNANGMKQIDHLRVKGEATFESPVLVTKSYKTSKASEPLKAYKQLLDDIDKQIKDVETAVRKCKEQLKDVIPSSGSSKLIKGMKYFYGQKTFIEELKVKHSFVGDTIKDQQQLDDIVQNLVRKNDERLIRGVKTFKSILHIGELQTIELNDKEANRLITTYQPAEIEGARYFTPIKVEGDVLVGQHSKIDGIDLSKKVVKLRDNYAIATCRFENLDSTSGIDLKNDIVNKKPFRELTRNIFNTNGDIVFPGSVMLKDFKVKKDLKAYTVMGVDFENLLGDLVYKGKNEKLESINFRSNVSCRDLFVAESINNDKFPQDFVSRSRNLLSFGSKSFDKINFRQLTVSGYVDTINTTDIVTKFTPQTVSGTKTFTKGIKVYGDLNIDSELIDGVDINLLFAEDEHENNKIKTIVFGETVSAPGMVVKGLTNGLNMENIAEDLVYKDSQKVIISGKTNFLRNVNIKDQSTLEVLNDIPLSSFVSTKSSPVINSHKIFEKKIIFEDIFVLGFVSNTNISDLFTNSLYLNVANQVVMGEKIFISILSPNLFVEDTLNRKSIAKFLTKSSSQILDVDLTINKAFFSKINASKVILSDSGLINGQDFSANVEILKTVNLLDNVLTVRGNVILNNLKSSTINNYKVKGIHDLLLRDHISQYINNNVAFQSLTIGGPIVTSSLINDNPLNLKEITKTALKLTEKNLIYHTTVWDEIIVDEMNVGGLVNGFNLKSLERDSVFGNDGSSLSMKGTKQFLKGFKVRGNLDTNTVNGKNLRKLLFSRTTAQNISSRFTFDSVKADNAKISYFNGIEIDRIKHMPNRGDFLIKGPIEFGGFVETTSLEIEDFINQHNLRAALQDAIKLDDQKIVITGKKNFVRHPRFENLIAVNVNEEDLDRVLEVYRNNIKDLNLDSLVVAGNVVSPSVNVGNIHFDEGEENFLSPKEIREHFVVFDEKETYEPLTFDSLLVQNDIRSQYVNGVSLSKDLLTRNTEQIIWQPVTVSALETANVSVVGKINGFLLPERLYTENEQVVIPGSVHFNKSISIHSDILVHGKLGHRKLSVPEDLIQLNTDSQLKGEINIKWFVTTTIESSNKKLNDIPLSTLGSSLRSYRNLFNKNKSSLEPMQYSSSIKNIYKKECKRTSYLQTLLLDNLENPKGFDLVYIHDFAQNNYKINVDNTITQSVDVSPVVVFRAFSFVWLLASTFPGSCSADVYSWNEHLNHFVLNYTLNDVGYVVQWAVLEESTDSVSLLAISTSKEKKCGSAGSSLWRAKQNDYTLHRIKSLVAGDKVLIDPLLGSSKQFFIQSGNNFSTYQYINGNPLMQDPLPEARLNFVRWLRGMDDTLILVRVWNGKNIDITVGGVDETQTLFMDAFIEDLALLRYHDDVYFILCCSYFNGEKNDHYIQVFKYVETSKLTAIDWFTVDDRTRIYPLPNERDGSDSAFVAFVHDFGTPKIYKIGGKPFMNLVTELPLEFGRRVWINSFHDSNRNFHLVFGDNTKALITRLNWVGKKCEREPIECSI